MAFMLLRRKEKKSPLEGSPDFSRGGVFSKRTYPIPIPDTCKKSL